MARILLCSSSVRVHDSQACRKMDVTRERISCILDTTATKHYRFETSVSIVSCNSALQGSDLQVLSVGSGRAFGEDDGTAKALENAGVGLLQIGVGPTLHGLVLTVCYRGVPVPTVAGLFATTLLRQALLVPAGLSVLVPVETKPGQPVLIQPGLFLSRGSVTSLGTAEFDAESRP